ncbi:dihydropyrimidinase [Halopenitus persicus]|uniref:dihydropyrimidinase n=1 Tax=Halopenitus persicus TaxID=1048396 RepID=UPI0012FE4310|nr:dihydropyrimidinase [Halopenitus persicus]
MHHTVISGGTVVTPEQTAEMDIGLRNGEIVTLSDAGVLDSGTDRTIDASGQYVFPGFIDSHVHVKIPLGEFVTRDGFAEATRAAAHGGTTTIVPFAIPNPDERPLEAYERRRENADGNVFTNYGLHACLTEVTDTTLDEIPELIERGAASVKMFMVYEGRLMVSHGEIREAFETIEKNDGLALIHAEDEEIIGYLVQQQVEAGETDFSVHPDTHPNVSETTAMWTIADLVEETGCPAFFVHVSTKEAERVLESAADREIPLLAETCPHYLTLTREVYNREDGEKFVCSPPIRSQENNDRLWEMLDRGQIQTVNSDHCGYDTEQKEKYRDDITKMPMGLPGVETRNTVFYTDAVAEGRLSVERFVELTTTNIAKMLGLYPQKGTISVGSDADLVVFDPEETWTLKNDQLQMATDYSPFAGKQMVGRPTTTMVGGEVVVQDGTTVGGKVGEYVPTDGSNAKQTFSSRLHQHQ